MDIKRLGWLLIPLLLVGCRPSTFWSPDGGRLAMDPAGRLMVYDAASRKVQQFDTGGYEVFNPVWSPDGKRLLYYRAKSLTGKMSGVELATMDLATGKQTVLVRQAMPAGEEKPDGLFQGEDAKPLLRLIIKTSISASWSPDGRRLAYVAGEKPARIMLADAGGRGAKPLTARKLAQSHPKWSPDGKWLAHYSSPPDEAEIKLDNDQPLKGSASLVVTDADGGGVRLLWDASKRDGLLPVFDYQWASDSRGLLVMTPLSEKANNQGLDQLVTWYVPLSGAAPEKRWVIESPLSGFSPDLSSRFTLGAKMPDLFTDRWPNPMRRQLGTLKIEPGGTPSAFPHPAYSPDGKTVALLAPKPEGKTSLTLIDVANGKLEEIPLP